MTKDRLGKNKKRKSASQISYPQPVFAKASPGFGSPRHYVGGKEKGQEIRNNSLQVRA